MLITVYNVKINLWNFIKFDITIDVITNDIKLLQANKICIWGLLILTKDVHFQKSCIQWDLNLQTTENQSHVLPKGFCWRVLVKGSLLLTF